MYLFHDVFDLKLYLQITVFLVFALLRFLVGKLHCQIESTSLTDYLLYRLHDLMGTRLCDNGVLQCEQHVAFTRKLHLCRPKQIVFHQAVIFQFL